jgi:ABC-type multidrug transport system ATPase subunit
MDEANLCDRVALIQDGQILAVDTPRRIVERFGRKTIAVRAKEMFRLTNDLRQFSKTESAYAFGQNIHFTGIDDDVEVPELETYLTKQNHEDIFIEEIAPGIEDVFMGLMKKVASYE